MSTIQDNIARVKETMEKAARKAGRKPHEIQLIAVSKTHPAERIQTAHETGQIHFGENRVQEAETKIETLSHLDLQWHLIGHLQTNKAKKAATLFSWIHSVDSPRLAKALEKEAAKLDRSVNILLQVNIAEEEQKFGAAIDDFETLLNTVKESPHLTCHGLMIIPPFFDSAEESRGYFKALRELGEKYTTDLVPKGKQLELSMGMSHDFPVAIEEGATMVRVGTAIFGMRHYC
ncbi:YggS family pyridoxal phosphate-dependent enzyme [bacterium]|nr:YggS family pyridoxal phosphate-dependent enzyme [bacterium]